MQYRDKLFMHVWFHIRETRFKKKKSYYALKIKNINQNSWHEMENPRQLGKGNLKSNVIEEKII